MQVNPGELNKKIQIVKAGKKDNRGFGGEPIVIRKCFAKYTRQKGVSTGTEKTEAGTDYNYVSVRFLIRYSPTVIDTNMKVVYKNRTYNILDVNDIGDRHEYIEVYCDTGEM